MLIILIAWVYITIVCNSWGRLLLLLWRRCRPNDKGQLPAFAPSIVNLSGLAILGCIFQVIATFTSLGQAWLQLIVLAPSIFFAKEIFSMRVWTKWKAWVKQHPLLTVFIVAAVFMLLVLGAYPVVHPDTAAYHYPLIEWATQYGTVPGIANVDYLYGLQSNWFLLGALFRFSFLNLHAISFVNTAVLVWVVVFLVQRIAIAVNSKDSNSAAGWLLFVTFGILDYQQIRLTASSMGPDYIAAIYVLAALLLLLNETGKEKNALAAFFCMFAVTLKLSVAPALLLVLYALPPWQRRHLILLTLICVVTAIPFLIRNYISSGLPLFPAAIGNWWHPDWQYNLQELGKISAYVTSFARTHTNNPAVHASIHGPADWLPLWWKGLSAQGKLLIGLQPVIAIAVLRWWTRFFAKEKVVLAILYAGLLFWFLKAPDPRFGYAFLLGIPAVVIGSLRNRDILNTGKLQVLRSVWFLCLVVTLAIAAYDVYRLKFYFSTANLFVPPGRGFSYQTLYYRQVQDHLPLTEKGIPVIISDSIQGSPQQFHFRGPSLADGFRQP